jgi:hypothetical protein
MDPEHDAITSSGESAEFLLGQYAAVRAEILQLMSANESRTFTAFGVSATIWAGLAVTIGNPPRTPGVAFILPIPLLLVAWNTHVMHSRRVANLGSFLSASTRYHFGNVGDWETEVSVFARRSNIRMSSRLPVGLIYWFASVTTICVGITVALIAKRSAGWRALDLVLCGALSLGTLVSLARLQRAHDSYAAARSQFDEYWNKRFYRADESPHS